MRTEIFADDSGEAAYPWTAGWYNLGDILKTRLVVYDFEEGLRKFIIPKRWVKKVRTV